MTARLAWSIQNDVVISQEFEFPWTEGFSISEKQKNIRAFHKSIYDSTKGNALEVSSKGVNSVGKNLSAFSLKTNGVYLENVFQAAKKFERGGPYLELLSVSPKEAKQYKKLLSSGKLVAFVHDGIEWSLEPKTAFYDYIYINALVENYGLNLKLSQYEWFTDIEFNHLRSVNCQARSAAIYKLLQKLNQIDLIKDKENWLDFHKKHVKG